MHDDDKNIRGSLVLDFGILLRQVYLVIGQNDDYLWDCLLYTQIKAADFVNTFKCSLAYFDKSR